MSQLKVDSIVPVAGAPTDGGGGVIQFKQTRKTDTFSRNSSNSDFGDVTGLNVSITPKSSTSRMVVLVSLCSAGNTNQRIWYRIKKVISGGGTDVTWAVADAAGDRPRASATIQPPGGNSIVYFGGCFDHVSGTTSQITYTIQVGAESSQPHRVNRSNDDSNSVNVARGMSTISVMEVSA